MYKVLPCLAWLVGVVSRAPSRDVLTTQGWVRGYLEDHPRTPYYAYRSIYYSRAKQHRFKAPRPVRRWDGVFEATHRSQCPQAGGGEEDCLVLSVFSPQRAEACPVLVLVHGGDFQSGWGAFQPPTRLLAQNLIIVTFNYRLGVLGFLCLGTPEAPGNVGLKDQVAALYWVQKNIENFGGNPHDVTVYGVESGAAAVQLILLSGAARGLVHKAILESGSALSPLSLSYEPLLSAFEAAKQMGYKNKKNTIDLAKFYGELNMRKLVNLSTVFLPCVENKLDVTHSLVESDPIEMLKQRNYQAVPMIIAYTNTLGASRTDSELLNAQLPENFYNLLPNNLAFDNDNIKHRVAELVREFYLGKRHEMDENMVQNYMEYISDVIFEYPIIKAAVLHAATGSTPTYLMVFTTKNTIRGVPGANGYSASILHHFYDEHGVDETTAQRLVALWTNFIRIGDPTPLTTYLVPVIWQPVIAEDGVLDVTSVRGLVLGNSKQIRMSDSLAHSRILFWDQIYKRFYRLHGPPYGD